MKNPFVTAILLFAAPAALMAQVSLTGTNYTQNFDSLGNGLPNGWTTRLGVSASSVGTASSFANTNPAATANVWSNTTGAFKNFASATGLSSGSTTADQTNSANRALGIRPTGSFGDVSTNYAGFVLQLNNTAGLENFSLSMDAMLLSPQGRTNVWTLDYGLGASPTSFTSLTNWTTPAEWGTTSLNISSVTMAGLANQSENVWIRFSILSPSTGSGSRDSVGIDNFSLSYTALAGTEYFWTGDGSTLGGTGTWNAANATWSAASSPVSGVVWDSSKKAVFTNSAATITVDSVSANKGMQFASTGFVLDGGTITLGGSNASLNIITAESGVTAEIGSVLAGSAGLTKSGAGTLVLSGSNSFSGGLTVSGGTLQIAGDGSLGDAANDIVLNGALKTVGNVSIGAGRDFSGSATFDLASGTTLTINGAVSNTSTVLLNPSTLDLQGSARSLGALTVNAASTISGSGAVSASSVNASALGSGTVTFDAEVVFGGGDPAVSVGAGGTVDFNSAVSNGGGTGRIAKTGAGTLILGANNTGGLRVGAAGAAPTAGGTVILESKVVGSQATAIQHNFGTLSAASNLTGANAITNGLSIGGRTGAAAVLSGSDMEFQGQSSFFRGTGTSGQLVLNVDNTTTFSGGFGATSGGGTATGITIGGTGEVVISGASSTLVENITLAETITLTLNQTIGGGVSIGNGVAATLGGNGGLLGSLFLGSDAKFIFDLNNTGLNALTVGDSATDTVSFGAGFGIDSLVGLDSSVANGAYTIIDGPATFDFANVSNLGSNNAVSLGDGKFAYFSEGSLQVNVVPEPSTYAMLALAGAGFAGYVIRRRRR